MQLHSFTCNIKIILHRLYLVELFSESPALVALISLMAYGTVLLKSNAVFAQTLTESAELLTHYFQLAFGLQWPISSPA